MPLIRKPELPSAAPSSDPALLLASLTNGNDDERWAAARGASDVPGGIRALGDALAHERNPRVREAIFTGLARSGTAESVEIVLGFLRSDDAPLRTGALDALRAMKHFVRPYVSRLLHDPDGDVRLLACELARNLPGDQATVVLCDLLRVEREPNVCAAAVEVLAEVGSQDALPVLAQCADRFRGIGFLEFALKLTTERIQSSVSQPRE